MPFNHNLKIVRGFGLFNPGEFKNKTELFDYVKSAGWELLGRGLYASVFSHPESKYIIKIFSKEKDKGAYTWLLFSYLYGKTSPHFVRVYDFFEVKQSELEYKKEYDYATRDYTLTDQIEDQGIWVIAVMEKLLTNEKKVKKISRALQGHGRDWEGTALFRGYVNALSSVAGCHEDCHQGNVMFRACGTWVLTDPLAGGDTQPSFEKMSQIRSSVEASSRGASQNFA